MPFKISKISSQPIWDTLPVAKITNYPFEETSFKPFAQVRMCISDNGIYLRMWAFETKKYPNSSLIAAFQFLNNINDDTLYIKINSNNIVNIYFNNQEICENIKANFFDGEDLEGIYWGACIFISNNVISKYFNKLILKTGYTFKGNFFKICLDTDFEHKGCFSKFKLLKSPNIFDKNYFEDFIIVEY